MTRNSHEWKRRLIWLRDKKICHWCGGQVSHKTKTLDHIIPSKYGGPSHPSNYKIAHADCNVKRDSHFPDVEEAIRINHIHEQISWFDAWIALGWNPPKRHREKTQCIRCGRFGVELCDECKQEVNKIEEMISLYQEEQKKFEYKMVIVVRKDLPMTVGKIGAQIGHACVRLALNQVALHNPNLNAWMKDGEKKIVLGADNQDELIRIENVAKEKGLLTELIRDAGRTQIPSGTITVLGIGPAKNEEFIGVTDKLKTL